MEPDSRETDDLFFEALVWGYVKGNRRFVRREWLASQLDEKLQPTGCRFILLTAEPGAGKSAFMAQLAHDHPDWLRYFIRRDQRSVLADVSDKSLLMRVGYQLAARHPELFQQEQLRLSVTQDMEGVSESAEVTGAKVNRLTASPFYQKVLEIQQRVRANNGRVVGLRVENLVIEPRLLPTEDLLHLALIHPALALQRADSDKRIVVLIDALDEIRYHQTAENILAWLTNCPEGLPQNIRFVLSSRPPDEILENFCNKQITRLSELKIEEDDPCVQGDVRQFVKKLTDDPMIVEALRASGGGAESFAAKAREKAHGNLGYLDALARGLDRAIAEIQAPDDAIHVRGQRTLEALLNLKELPADLEGLYGFFLRQIKAAVARERIEITDPKTGETYDKSVWPAVYDRVLGLLSVAREPLDLNLIERLGGIQPDRVWVSEAIDRLLQFLDVVQGRYRLYHATVAEFLTSEKTRANPETRSLFQHAKKRHHQIADVYWRHRKNWTECDDYGFSNLAIHLFEAGDSARLAQLIGQEWMNARVQNGGYTYSGFLLDVDVAWQAALNRSVSDESAFVQSFRYALIRTSVNSLSVSCPPALVVRAWEEGLWSSARVFSLAKILRQDPAVRMWAAVLGVDKLTPSERGLAERLALSEARNLQPASARFRAFTSLAAHLSDEAKLEALQESLKAVDEVKDANNRCRALTTLAPYLDPERKRQILDEVLNILSKQGDKRDRSDSDWQRASAIAELAPLLGEDLAIRALEIANTLLPNGPRSSAQTALIPRLPGNTRTSVVREVVAALESARAAARKSFPADSEGVNKEAGRTLEELGFRLLSRVVDYLSDDERERLLRDSLLLIDALGLSERDRYNLLLQIAPVLSSDLALQAIVTARGITSVGAWGEILAHLASRLPAEAEKLLSETQNAWTDAPAIERFVATAAWAANGPTGSRADLLRAALASAQQVIGAVWDFEKLVAIVSRLESLIPDLDNGLVEPALQLVLDPKLQPWRDQLLELIAPKLSGALLQRAFNAQVRIEDEGARVLAMSTLGSHLTGAAREDALEYALRTASQIAHFYPRVKVLARLAPLLSGKAKERAVLEGLKAVKNAYPFRDLALGYLAPSLSEQLIDIGLKTALQLNDGREQAYGLAALASKVSGDQKQELVREVLSRIANIDDSDTTIVQLAPSLEGPFVETALVEARRLRGRERLEALLAITGHSTGDAKAQLIRECCQDAKSLTTPREKVEVLLSLNPLLDGSLRHQVAADALATIEMAKEPGERVEMLAKAVPLLSDAERNWAIRECLASLPGLDDFHKAVVLKSLSLHLSEELCERAIEIAEAVTDVKARAEALAGLIVQCAVKSKDVGDRVALLSRIGLWLFSLRELRRENLLFFCTRCLFEQSLLSEKSLEETARKIQEIAGEWVFPS